MTSIEGYTPLFNRCKFNKPFSNVTMFKGLSSSFIPTMSRDELYLVWFDYDFTLNEVAVNDLIGLLTTLRAGSLVVLTVDIDQPKDLKGDGPRAYEQRYKADLPTFVTNGLSWRDFRPDRREATLREMLHRSVRRGLRARTGLSFEYLLWLTYADGHRMMSMAGVLADESMREMLEGAALNDLWFVRRTLANPVDIPRLVFTRKETLELEQAFPHGAAPLGRMGLTAEEVDALRTYYRYWPSYTEAVV